MAQPLEGSAISEISDGQYAYHYYNHKPEVIEFFESKGLQGGGYTWEALAKAGLKITKAKLADSIEFDSEGDALFASSESKKALVELETVIKQIASDTVFRDKCFALAEQDADLE
jgi:hypothetical protein